jgi:hypothetical protein
MECIIDDLRGFVDWYISEDIDKVKANKDNRVQKLYEGTGILNEGIRLSSWWTRSLTETGSEGTEMETNRAR